MKQQKLLLFVIVFLFLNSCSTKPPAPIIPQEPLEVVAPQITKKQEAGSLWSDKNTSMFVDRTGHNIGDIVTVLISESASASKAATTSTDRSSNMKASLANFFGLENLDFWKEGPTKPIDLSNLVNATMSNTFAGNGKTTRQEDLTASLTTQIIEKYPNGQLKIRGGKEVMVNDEVQIIYLTGIVRPVDITAANTVSSERILNARISYTGKGAISDKQGPGWAMRVLDTLWPF
ncbi:MAG: flagellar biosynthesis protein FlgH [Deltaproteobacteria bacterium]|nr:MAG: flagellar biosynthesis protein FlgH [Deltaproteobacteria bacterium]